MAPSDTLPATILTTEDLTAALPLSVAAGWNQTALDWRVFLDHGRVFGCRDERHGLIATAACLPYDGSFGFVSMVLVDAAWRHRGHATSLMQACIGELERQGMPPVLDATPEGAPVYEKLGFKPLFGLHRLEGEARAARVAEAVEAASGAVRPFRDADLEAATALDAAAFGAARGFLLADFLRRDRVKAIVLADGSGFALARPGFRATQIGPVVARRESDAIRLLETLLASLEGRVFLDVPDRQAQIGAWAAARGFRRQRPFTRMAKVKVATAAAASFGEPARLMAAAGPEFG